MPLPSHRWADLSTVDFASLVTDRTIAILPVAAIEQHGPHLPVSVDTTLAEGILDRAIAQLPAEAEVLVLPTQAVGLSSEHLAFPGTLSLSVETILRLWTEIGESVARAGVRRLLLWNAHGGQPQIQDLVARDLRVRLGLFAVTCCWWKLGLPPGLFSAHELTHGIHAGSVETSMMLHLAPDRVRMDRASTFPSLSEQLAEECAILSPEGAVGFGWMTDDLNPTGAVGNATDADAERGRALVEHAATRLVTLLAEMAAFDLNRLSRRG
ncbi:MAG: creatininase family protein [Alphaproteobacteria bacterium]|nr:MAG: creatininase family protein [Alphaproteobacteria bacterium]